MSDHGWSTRDGSFGWYSVSVPDDWKTQSNSDTLTIYAPRAGLQIVVRAAWRSSRTDDSEGSRPTVMFGGSFAVRGLTPLRLPQHSQGSEGRQPMPGRGLLAGVLPARMSRWWRMWNVFHDQVVLTCTVTQISKAAPLSELLVQARRILETIEFAEHTVAPPDVFADLMLSRMRRTFAELPIFRRGGLQLAVGEARVNLLNFYRGYRRDPDALDGIVESVLSMTERLLQWNTDEMEAAFEQVSSRVMPMLVPESVWQQALGDFVSSPWIARLRIMYVVDEEDAYWYIRRELLDEWQVTIDELHNRALSNLQQYFDERTGEMTAVDGEAGPRLLMPTTADAYNSVRLLHQPFHRRLQQLLGAEFAIGIPNRDFFVAVSLKNTDMLEKVRTRVASDYQTMDHPLTDRMLIVSTDGVSEYCD